MITTEQRQAAAEAVAEFMFPPCSKTGKYAKKCKESINNFILQHGLTEKEIEEAVERLSN